VNDKSKMTVTTSEEVIPEKAAYGDEDFAKLLIQYIARFQKPTDQPVSRPEDMEINLVRDTEIPTRCLIAKKYIVPSTSRFGANVLFRKKPGGSLIMCIDYRRLNSITERDCAPIPNVTLENN
jgi:hypothetical protein